MLLLYGDTSDGSIDGVIQSAIFDLDATIATSYSGSGQVWTNIVKYPADGSPSSAYNFNRGATTTPTTDDPTFNGTAGSKSAYWSFDGGDQFTIQNQTNTTFLEALHKTNVSQPFWLAFAFNQADFLASRVLFGTNTLSTSLGLRINDSSTEVVSIIQGDGTTAKTMAFTSALTIGTDYLFIVSYDGSANIRTWLNTRTKTQAAMTKNAATGAAQTYARLFLLVETGFRAYAASCGNSYIDDNQASAIINTYNTRHGRIYA